MVRIFPEALEEKLSRLPLEGTVDRLLNKAQERISESSIVKSAERVHESLPGLPEVRFPTPFGTISLPALKPPSPSPPKIDDRRRKGMKLAALSDVSTLVGVVPVVGDILGDALSDIVEYELKNTLTPDEFSEYVRQDRGLPSILAAIKTFARKR